MSNQTVKPAESTVTVSDVIDAVIAGLQNGQLAVSVNRTFSSGSRGHYISGKLNIGGEACQFGAPVTVIGSKPAK